MASLLLLATATAQDQRLETLIGESRVAMEEKRWEDALAISNRTIDIHAGNKPLETHGPQFGAVFYQKGLCEMKLKRWNDAIRSFEICYRDFPNKNPAAANANVFQKMALLKWGEAAMGAEKWDMAISRFNKFLEERDRVRDKYPQGAFHVNMAICRYETNDLARGNESLEIAIRNREVFPTPETGIVAGFQALVRAAVSKRDEQVLLDFIGKNRGELLIAPYLLQRFSDAFLGLAGDAIGAGMQRAALAIYQFVPATDVAIDDLRARLKSLGPAERVKDGATTLVRAELEADLARLEAIRRGKQPPEAVKLAAVAYLHEAAGNFHGAFAAYRQLELYFPNAEKREENLFNLIRVAARIGSDADVREFGARLLKDLPESPRVPETRRFVLQSLFEAGEHGPCIAAAETLLEQVKEGTPEHELALYLLGASLFNTAEHAKAQPLLDKHVSLYPTGEHAMIASYLQAANAVRAGDSAKGASLLDKFLSEHSDPAENSFLAPALYERAVLSLSSDDTAGALEKLERLLKEFPGDPITAQTLVLKGRVDQSKGDAATAEKDFAKALEIAGATGDVKVAGEALAASIHLLGPDTKRSKDTLVLVDRFWKSHADGSPWKTAVAIDQTKALVAAGRGDEAAVRLQDLIPEAAKTPDSREFRQLVDCYTIAFLSKHPAEELAKQYGEFPAIPTENRAALASLRMAAIAEFEKRAESAADDAAKQAAVGMVRTLFQGFKTDFAIKDVTSRDLLRLGDFLHLKTSTPLESLAYYDEVIGRDNPTQRFPALLGRGDVRSRSEVATDLDLALADFTTVYQDSKERAERDYALFRVIGLFQKKGDNDGAIRQAELYLAGGKESFTDFVPQVETLLASLKEKPRTSP